MPFLRVSVGQHLCLLGWSFFPAFGNLDLCSQGAVSQTITTVGLYGPVAASMCHCDPQLYEWQQSLSSAAFQRGFSWGGLGTRLSFSPPQEDLAQELLVPSPSLSSLDILIFLVASMISREVSRIPQHDWSWFLWDCHCLGWQFRMQVQEDVGAFQPSRDSRVCYRPQLWASTLPGQGRAEL